MSGYPTLDFGQSESGLFSPEEIALLMEREYQRSLRYGYPVSLLYVEIDRLESLHDLYGVDSEQRIRKAVVSLLRSSTRASDALGAPRGPRLLVMLPQTARAGAVVVASRLLAGCRELEFRGDGRNLRASLSIGIAAREGDEGLEPLTEFAEHALGRAVAGGGDRYVEHKTPIARPARGTGLRAVMPSPTRGAHSSASLPSVQELPGTTLEEKVRSLFSVAGSDVTGELEHEVLSLLRSALDEPQDRRATRQEVLREMRELEERIAQLKRMLEASEEELARMIEEKSTDPGMASLCRSVQGLDPSEQNYAKKKELLAVIYEANVELLRQLEREADRG